MSSSSIADEWLSSNNTSEIFQVMVIVVRLKLRSSLWLMNLYNNSIMAGMATEGRRPRKSEQTSCTAENASRPSRVEMNSCEICDQSISAVGSGPPDVKAFSLSKTLLIRARILFQPATSDSPERSRIDFSASRVCAWTSISALVSSPSSA